MDEAKNRFLIFDFTPEEFSIVIAMITMNIAIMDLRRNVNISMIINNSQKRRNDGN